MSVPSRARRKTEKTGAADARALLDAAGLSHQIGFVLRFAQSSVWNDLCERFRPFGLRPAHYSILLILREAPGSRQQEIGDALSIQRPNLVSLIDDLEDRGIVSRDAHPDDRRSHALLLTDAGKALLSKMERAQVAHEKHISALFSGNQRQQLLGALASLARLSDSAPI